MQEVKNTTCHFWVVDLEMVDFKPLKNELVRIEVKGSQFMILLFEDAEISAVVRQIGSRDTKNLVSAIL